MSVAGCMLKTCKSLMPATLTIARAPMKSAAICGIIAAIKLTELDLRSADACLVQNGNVGKNIKLPVGHWFCAVLGAVGQASAQGNTSVTLGRFPQTFSKCASIGPTISHATFMVGFKKSVEIWSTPGMRSFSALSWRGKERVSCACSNSPGCMKRAKAFAPIRSKLTVGIRF